MGYSQQIDSYSSAGASSGASQGLTQGAGLGALAGTAIAGPVGGLVGAVAGGAIGYFTGQSKGRKAGRAEGRRRAASAYRNKILKTKAAEDRAQGTALAQAKGVQYSNDMILQDSMSSTQNIGSAGKHDAWHDKTFGV
jgi:hypothetical protein|tara:strand:- start:124 stop:537 length:414 start_codon:yes stop_codon:yes gene_type:complete